MLPIASHQVWGVLGEKFTAADPLYGSSTQPSQHRYQGRVAAADPKVGTTPTHTANCQALLEKYGPFRIWSDVTLRVKDTGRFGRRGANA